MRTPEYILIGQYHGISWISKAIRLFTWSNISHTSAFMPGMQEIIEAWQYTGVIKRPWRDGHAPGTVIDVYRVPCTQEQSALFYQEMEANIGTPYDYWGILGFIARDKLHNPKKLFCSKLVFRSAKMAGIKLLERIEAHQVSPGMLNVSPLLEHHKTLIV